jgi:general secretion pathway protein C
MFILAGQNRSLVIVVNLLLIVWLAHNLAGLSWRLLPNADQQAIPVVMPIDAPRQQQQALNIARWHLFGNIEARPVVSAQRVEDMPVTRLKLILRGVVSGGNGSMSGAIIADPSGKQSFYVLGADLPGGAILKEVHERNIVLLRNGQLETLQLPSDQLNDLDESTPDTEPLPDVNASSALTDQPLMSLIEYRDTLLQNPQQLADVVQARPYNRNGVSGYQINPGRDAALFSQLGLQPNDVITEVNGIKLDNPARGLNVLQTLQQDGPVMVEVLRGGVSQTLTVDLNQ